MLHGAVPCSSPGISLISLPEHADYGTPPRHCRFIDARSRLLLDKRSHGADGRDRLRASVPCAGQASNKMSLSRRPHDAFRNITCHAMTMLDIFASFPSADIADSFNLFQSARSAISAYAAPPVPPTPAAWPL